MKMTTIHSKINLMMYILGIIFLLLLFKLYLTTKNQEKLISKESQVQFQNEVSSIIENKTELLKQVANDYTFWDDFVNHLSVTDTAWFRNNITTIIKSFRVDYVCVYDTSKNLLHEAASPQIQIRSLINKDSMDKLHQKRFLSYFQMTGEGLFEISAASVHNESDPTHMLTDPKAYLFLANKWDQKVLANLSTMSDDEVKFLLPSDPSLPEGDYDMKAAVPVYDQNARVLGQIVFKRSSNLISLYRRTSFFMILTMLISTVLTWLVISYASKKWLTKPLKMVTKILQTEDRALIAELKQCPGEFKQIGALFAEFVDQKRELVKAKEKAVESDRLKSAFLANMSHEVRTPMNGILGFVELLKEPKLSGEEQKEYIQIIEESGQRMLNIINDIISISKVESGQTELVITDTSINDQIRYIYTFFKPEAEKKGLHLIYNPGLSDLEANMKTDREKLYAILTNLVKNAIKFTERGLVDFGYTIKDDYLEFYVRDTGLGIQANQQNLIFERFRQASESLARQYEGAGLGLAISKAYVEMLGGKIWVESEMGKGSIFYFTVPFAQQKEIAVFASEQLAEKTEPQTKKGLKILIAEDDLVSDLFLVKLIKPYTRELIKVRNGNEAVKASQDNPDIDLILMDVQMPELDGYEATRLIREFNSNVVIIAQTALGVKGEKDKALEAGCDDFLLKPFSSGELKELILTYFEHRV